MLKKRQSKMKDIYQIENNINYRFFSGFLFNILLIPELST